MSGPPREIDRDDSASAAGVFKALWPDSLTRQACARRLADSIRVAHEEADGSWSVTLFQERVRLNVGQVAVLTLLPTQLRVLVRRPVSGDIGELEIEGDEDEPWYRAVSVPSGLCRVPPARVGMTPSAVVAAHESFIRAAANAKRVSPFKHSFSPGVLGYLEQVVGHPLPRPAYLLPVRATTRSSARAHPIDDEEFGTTDDYLRAFEMVQAEDIPHNHLSLLRTHLAAPAYTTTWTNLAEAVGYPTGSAVNLQYGKFAKRVARHLGLSEKPVDPNGSAWWLWVLVRWADERDSESGHTAFVLRRPVIEALRQLGLLENSSAAVRYWWFGFNNENDPAKAGHVRNADVVPLLRGEATTYAWPFGGAPISWKYYPQMKVADRVLLWRGDGDDQEWGVMGIATIARIEGSEKKRRIFLRLDRLFEPPITPYPSKSRSPRTTPESDFLWKVFGEAFRPLHKVFKRLEYPSRKSFTRSPVTVWPMTGRQFEALSRRRSAGADEAPGPVSYPEESNDDLLLPGEAASETTAQRLAALPRDPAEVSAIEGEPRMFFHMRRERDPALVRAKREVARNSAGQLECEACGFVAETAYPGCLSGELCEVHHRIPLGDLAADTTETRLEDLAILCPNCHRAIHQTRPMMRVEDFREWLRRRPI